MNSCMRSGSPTRAPRKRETRMLKRRFKIVYDDMKTALFEVAADDIG